MGGGGTPAVTSSNQTSNPWSGVQQPMLDLIGQAGQLYSQPYSPYLGSTIAGLSDSTIAAQNGIYQRATLGAADLNAARGMATDVAGGAYLGSNPYVQQNSDWTKQVMADNAANQASGFATGTAALNDAMAARSGVFGGSAHLQKQSMDAANLANSIGQAGNQYNLQRSALGAQDYQSGMNNMLQAGSLAGTLSQDDYASLNMLRQQGLDQQAQEQKYLDKAEADYNAAMNFPQQSLTNYANLLSQFGGFGSSGTTATYGGGQSPLGLGIGAGLLGLGAYNAFK